MSVDELDTAITAFNGFDATERSLTPDFISKLAAVKKIQDMTGLDTLTLLAFWAPIRITGDHTLYTSLFLRRTIKRLDSTFTTSVTDDGTWSSTWSAGDTPLEPHLPAVLAATRCSRNGYASISQSGSAAVKSSNKWTNLTIENLTILIRSVALATAAGIAQTSLGAFTSIFPDIFTSPQITLDRLTTWAKLSTAGLSTEQVLYAVGGSNLLDPQSSALDLATLKASQLLNNGLLDTLSKYPDSTQAVLTVDQLKQLASTVFSDAMVQKAFAVLQGHDLHDKESLIQEIQDTLYPIPKFRGAAFTTHVQSALLSTANPDSSNAVKMAAVQDYLVSALRRTAQEQVVAGALSSGAPDLDSHFVLFLLKQILKSSSAASGRTASSGGKPASADPGHTVPGHTDPGHTVPGHTVPGHTDPGHTVPGHTVPGHTVPGHTDPSGTAPGTGPPSNTQPTNAVKVVAPSTDSGVTAHGAIVSGTADAESYVSGFDSLLSLYVSDTSASTTNVKYSGYVNPPTTDDYVFVLSSQAQPSPLTLDGKVLSWSQEGTSWVTDSSSLSADQLYSVLFPNSKVQWKTSKSPKSEIPSTAKISGDVFETVKDVLSKMERLSLVIDAFSLNQEELSYLQNHGQQLSGIQFNALDIETLGRLAGYAEIRGMAHAIQPTSLSSPILNVLRWASRNAKSASMDILTISQQMTSFTGWDTGVFEVVLPIVAKSSDSTKVLAALNDERTVETLFKMMDTIRKIGAGAKNVGMIFDWAQPSGSGYIGNADADMKVADSITQFARSLINDDDWDKTITPINDQLRKNRRDAMIAYLLQQDAIKDWGATDADGLFEYFLIDVQMGTSLNTSRIKSALAAVQVFVQRAMLGLEPTEKGKTPFAIDTKRWEWMQKYRVWEAARKIYLWPENWLNSSLLDIKSPIFVALESDLRQNNMTLSTAQNALMNYLYALNDIADLEYISSYRDPPGDTDNYTLHLFGRTRHSPYVYYYRTRDTITGWTPWEQMQIDLPNYHSDNSNDVYIERSSDKYGTYIVPYVWEGRILIFIPQLSKVDIPGLITTSIGSTTPSPDKARTQTWQIQLSWSEYRAGNWSPKKAIAATLQDLQRPDTYIKGAHAPNPDSYVFGVHASDSNTIVVNVVKQYTFFDTDTGIASIGDTTNYYVGDFNIDCSQMDVQVDQTDRQDGLLHTSWDDLMHFQISFFNGAVLSPQFFQGSKAIPARGGTPASPAAVQLLVSYPITLNKTSTTTSSRLQLVAGSASNTSEDLSHGFAHKLVEAASGANVDVLDTILELSELASPQATGAFGTDKYSSYSALAKPYSIYNWELALFVPMLFVDSFLSSQQFDEALKVLRYIFNPQATTADRVWIWKPFAELSDPKTAMGLALQSEDFGTTWSDTPFDPFAVARAKPRSFMVWVVAKYIQVLIAYGDFYFRQNTLETLPEAIQCYIEASHLCGPRIEQYPSTTQPPAQTYATLTTAGAAAKKDLLSQLELAFPWVPDAAGGYPKEAIWLAGDTMTSKYFCTPINANVVALRDTLDDRLHKIRNSMDINGNFRVLPLFEPPIDPGLLVRAAAAGALNLSNVLNGLDAPLPNVRFSRLLQKAMDICSDLRSFGSTLLSAKQSKDNEAFAALQAKQNTSTQQLTIEMKKLALEQAQKTLDALRVARQGPVVQLKHFLQLAGEDLKLIPGEDDDFQELDEEIDPPVDGDLGITAQEQDAMNLTLAGIVMRDAAVVPDVASGDASSLPDLTLVQAPMGGGLLTTVLGGSKLGQQLDKVAKGLLDIADVMSSSAAVVQQKADWKSRLWDRKGGANSAGYAIKAIDKQIDVQNTLIALAQKDLDNQQSVITAAGDIERFLKSKTTSVDLYTYMDGILQNIFYQTYNIAYDMAKKAEKAYRFEKGIDAASQNIIDFGYWDISHNGLLAGEQLYVGLRKLEQAYDETRGYDFEIKKDVSLRQLDASALYDLRANGTCNFSLPEVLFDMDFPGHYRRRLKSIALTFSGVSDGAGSISATLTLISHKYRVLVPTKLDYSSTDTTTPDPTFQADNIPINSVAVSSPTISSSNGDTGTFALDFSTKTYQPFESAGAISSWSLELSRFSALDPSTISDVTVHLQYTASNAPSTYKDTVVTALTLFMKGTSAVNLRTTFDLSVDVASPSAWHTFATPNPALKNQGTRTLSLAGLGRKFPFYARAPGKKITVQSLWLFTDLGATEGSSGTPSLSYTSSGTTSSVSLGTRPTHIAGGLARWENKAGDDISGVPLTGNNAASLEVVLTGMSAGTAVGGMVLAVGYKVV